MSASPPKSSDDHVKDLLERLTGAEAQLATLSREVEHLQRLATIGTLSAGIIHEINNQLTPALAQAQVARLNSNQPQRLMAALDHCIQGITRAGRIAESMIGFASPAAGEGELNEQERGDHGGCPAVATTASANVAQALKTAIVCIGVLRDRASVRIEANVPPAAWVAMEPIALQQVLVNLLLNSIKALKEVQDPLIRVSTRSIDGPQIEIVVEDNGPGIPSSIRENLFRPFTSAPPSKHAPKGTGLGLAVSRRLVHAAGGSINAGSSRLGGAQFTVRLASILSSLRAKIA